MYPGTLLAPIYRKALQLSRRRGEHSLARMDAWAFRTERQVFIDKAQNISINLPPDPHFFRYLIQSHENHVRQVINMLVKEGDTVVDIGANVGYFSACAAASVGRTGKVFCLEPEHINFLRLQSNCETLQQHGYHCTPYEVAASSVAGQATLRVHRHSTYHAIEDDAHPLDHVEDRQTINTTTLDDWAKTETIERIALLKIDTEGHEPKVLEGARQLFQRKAVDYILLECRSDELATFIDQFCREFQLHQMIWDGQKWLQTTSSSLSYREDCLLSLNPLTPNDLC